MGFLVPLLVLCVKCPEILSKSDDIAFYVSVFG